MGKRVGKPYDPEIRLSEAGVRLYNTWRKIRRHPHCEEWGDYPTFYEWAIHGDYSLGDWLQLIDSDGPYCPDNCIWYTPRGKIYHENTREDDCLEWIEDWNRAVNRIRKHYGMSPLEGTNYGD